MSGLDDDSRNALVEYRLERSDSRKHWQDPLNSLRKASKRRLR